MPNQKFLDAPSFVEHIVAKISDQYQNVPFEWAVAFRLLRQVSWRGMETFDSILKTWDITAVEYLILGALYGAEDYTFCVTELPERVNERSSYIGRMINQLEKKGVVARGVAIDRRKGNVTLTDAGADLLKELVPPLSAMVEDQVQKFSTAELAELVRLLKKMFDTYP